MHVTYRSKLGIGALNDVTHACQPTHKQVTCKELGHKVKSKTQGHKLKRDNLTAGAASETQNLCREDIACTILCANGGWSRLTLCISHARV